MLTTWDRDMPGWKLSTQQITYERWQINCSIVDLTAWAPPQIPGAFVLSLDVPLSWVLVESNGQWQMVAQLLPSEVSAVRLLKRKHGWSFGYKSQELVEIFEAIELFKVKAGVYLKPLLDETRFSPRTTYSDTVGPSVVLVSVQEPLVTVTRQLGYFRQIQNLISSLGGYVTAITLIFTTVFVKKYPKDAVSVIYDMRTLIGFQSMADPAHAAPDSPNVMSPLNPAIVTPNEEAQRQQVAADGVTLTGLTEQQRPARDGALIGRGIRQMPPVPSRPTE